MNFHEMSPFQLGESASSLAIPYLIRYLTQGTNNEKRLAASAVRKLTGLHRSDCNQAVPALVRCLTDQSAPQVRQYALKALCDLYIPADAIQIIVKLAKTDEKKYNRVVAERLVQKQLKVKKVELPVSTATVRREPETSVSPQQHNTHSAIGKTDRGLVARNKGKLTSRTASRDYVRDLLRQSLGLPDVDFRNGQWEAIDALVNRHSRLLVVERTGWGKSSVYFIATRILRDRGLGPTLIV